MVNDFVFALTELALLLHDPDFVQEARTFVADGKGSYSATSNNHDDVIMGTLVAYQGCLDSHKYVNLWEDSNILPPTHDEMDAIWFNFHEETADDILERPLGQRAEPVKVIKTVAFTEANTKRK
jgi:hypothetical protein